MAKLGQGIVRQGMAEGVSNLTTLPTVLKNWGEIISRKLILEALNFVLMCVFVHQKRF